MMNKLTGNSPKTLRIKLIVIIICGIFFVYVLYAIMNMPRPTTMTDMNSQKNGEKVSFQLDKSRNEGFKIRQRGNYWVFQNYHKADENLCDSITYTTHGDFTFLENLEPVVKRWLGPVSIALYAPGSDFKTTSESIKHLVRCSTVEVRRYVSFHIFFEGDHMPEQIEKDLNAVAVNCASPPPWERSVNQSSYRNTMGLTYPINVARNIARESARTRYILASDIEVYPSAGIIAAFSEMIQRIGEAATPTVYPLAVFEVESDVEVPLYKNELIELISQKKAFPFHQKVCRSCHTVPRYKDWIAERDTGILNVFAVAKREKEFAYWEPFYIGTNAEPGYDEILSWEGKKDKMTQGYAMCAMDYEYHLLNNGFLVHKPGVKKLRYPYNKYFYKTWRVIRTDVLPVLKIIYGDKKGCKV